MIIDTHLHLDERVDGTAFAAARELDRQLAKAGVARAIVLHLEAQPWSPEEFAKALEPYSRLYGFVNVHPKNERAAQILSDGVEKHGFIGLKLHPRLQEFGVDDKETIQLVRIAGELKVPVLIDAFPDGTHIMQGFSAKRYATLAEKCQDTRIIWAHMGGHHVIDFMMLAKRLPNVYLDFSYSLLYYQSSTIPQDMVYAMRSMKFSRIFYGSDYPDRQIEQSLEMSLSMLKAQGLGQDELNRIMGGNAQEFFGWNDL